MKPIVCGSLLLWAAVSAAAQSSPPQDPAPLYIESSIANSASPQVEGLAPNTLATVYGQYLSRVTRAVSQDEIITGTLPTTLRGTGVRVMVGGILAPLLYVSPGQINFVVPPTLLPGVTDLRVGIDSRYGPSVRVRIEKLAPALFQADPEFGLATHPSGALISRDAPALADEIIVLYATGLGTTSPRIQPGQLVREAAVVTAASEFRVYLNDAEIPPERVLYAGLAPGFAGLYQINLRLPLVMERNPTIRIGFGNVMSQTGIRLAAEPQEP